MKKYISNLKGTVAGSKGMIGFAAVAVLGVIAWSYMREPAPEINPSVVNTSAMNSTTIHGGTEKLPREYVAALDEADRQRTEAAKSAGLSAQPTIQGSVTETATPIELNLVDEDKTPEIEEPDVNISQIPLALSVPMTETVPIVTAPPPMVAVENPEQINNMINAMARRPLPVAEVVQFGAVMPEPLPVEQSSPAVAGTETGEDASKVKLPLAGKILYAQLIGRANSDHPGPVLARVLQGDYTGATLIGSFQVSQNALTISFDRMTVERDRAGTEINEVVPIQAVAVDTQYIGTGLATKVDRHLFQKLAIAFTAGFAQGFGEAIAETGETTIDTGNGTITTGGKNLDTKEELLVAGGQAVGSAGSILQQEFGNRPTTVIVEAGTPIGVLFLQ